MNFLKSTNESNLGISHLYACEGGLLSSYIRIFGMGLNNFIKMGVAGWEEFQSYSNSGLIYTVQELAFLPETLKEFTG